MLKKSKILNSRGEEVLLNEHEAKLAKYYEKVANDMGYEVDITTLTTVTKRVVEQKFFEVAPADYLPVRVGEGSFSSNLLTYRSYATGDDFGKGIINQGSNQSRLASADVGVDALSIKVFNWAKELNYTIFEIEQASRSGNWDIVTAKEKSRKTNWDLGIQSVAFLGSQGSNGTCLGLLNQAGITPNTTVITKTLSSMTPTELKTFQANILEAYRNRCARTAWPTHFIIPESDYNGLAAQSSADFPLKSVLQLLEEAFQTLTKNKNFKILPLAYADIAYSNGVLTKSRYTLLKYDEESIRMDIPVDYTNTLANSLNGFQFSNVGYGQFTGVLAYRPLELMYFEFP